MPISIVVWAHLDERARQLIRDTLPDEAVHFADRHQPTAIDRQRLAEAEVVFGNLPAKSLPQSPRLRWMQLESVGFEYYQKSPEVTAALKISNLKGMFEWPAAETALAGVLAAPIQQVSALMGVNLVLVVFAVVVIGGMGSIMGSIVTGFGLGLVEGLTKVFYPPASNTVIFVVMALVLLIKPAGLFGQTK